MKKLLSLLLVLLIVFSFTACDEAVEVLDAAADAVSELNSIASDIQDLGGTSDDVLSGETEENEASSGSEQTDPSEESSQTVELTLAAEGDAVELISTIDEDGVYTTKEDVALYLHTYGRLPSNFMTKNEARALGWEGGSLEPYAPGMCIGGDRFGNYEELLPTDRTYYECDIDTLGASSRGAKRIVFSADGLIYYTEDHYESFELLYGEP